MPGATLARKRSPRSRTIASIWAEAQRVGLEKDAVYARASAVVGRRLVEGFGLTTCTEEELLRIAAVIRGGAPHVRSGDRCSGPHPRPPRLRGNAVRMASLAQYQFVQGLQQQLRLSDDELAGVARQACQKTHPVTSRDLGKVIEALKVMRERLWGKAAATSPQTSAV